MQSPVVREHAGIADERNARAAARRRVRAEHAASRRHELHDRCRLAHCWVHWLDRCRPGGVTRLKVLRGEPASAVELHATPLDLLTVMEQRRGQAGPGGGGGGGGGGNGAPPQKPGPPAAQGKGNEGPYPETYY
jgi:hypothetical protein